jgi:hypothetical protein
MHFPNSPAVLTVELFRVANGNIRDGRMHCQNHLINVTDSSDGKVCFVCPQWWLPQDWRAEAIRSSSVASVSYRDAVWPVADKPPENLCKYWSGLSHPEEDTHILVASAVLFQFLTVMQHTNTALLDSPALSDDNSHGFDMNQAALAHVCLNHFSSFTAVAFDPVDPMPFDRDGNSSCWQYRADVRHKYGWICKEKRDALLNKTMPEYLLLQKQIRVGGKGNVLISRLVSYDKRMSVAKVWFTSAASSENVFDGNLIWNISSWHAEKTSIPQTQAIQLNGTAFTEASNMHWPTKSDLEILTEDSTILLILNMQLVIGSSMASKEDGELGIDKFKLLGITTC